MNSTSIATGSNAAPITVRIGKLESIIEELNDTVRFNTANGNGNRPIVRVSQLAITQMTGYGYRDVKARIIVTALVDGQILVWAMPTGRVEEFGNGSAMPGRPNRNDLANATDWAIDQVKALLEATGATVRVGSMFHVPEKVLEVDGATELFDLRQWYQTVASTKIQKEKEEVAK